MCPQLGEFKKELHGFPLDIWIGCKYVQKSSFFPDFDNFWYIYSILSAHLWPDWANKRYFHFLAEQHFSCEMHFEGRMARRGGALFSPAG